MKMKRLLVLAALGAGLIPGLTSCGNKIEEGGSKLVQIRTYKGGYGDDWLREVVSHFNKTFEAEGYKAEIVESSALVTETAGQEILVPNKNQIDLYFTNGSDISTMINKSKNILRSNDKVVVEQLDDILSSKAIGFDGKEEEQTIGERLIGGFAETSKYNGTNEKWAGKTYKLPWADAMTGLFCNTTVLNKYGIDVPLTSNELVSAIKTIASKVGETQIYPYSMGGSNASGYWSYLWETWFAQYSTAQGFINFEKCVPSNGDIKNNGYEVYQDKGILKSLEAMYDILDLNYCSNGSSERQHTEAQTEFVLGKSAFMINGDWLMNEMKENYSDKASDIIMVKAPILSSIGAECGLTDAELHDVVKAIDNSKTNDEIKAAVSKATDAGIDRIREARSIHDSIGTSHDLFIPSYADAKDAAKLFVRYLYSNDGCNTFRQYANANLPLKYTIDDDLKAKTTNYLASLDSFYEGNAQMVSGSADYNTVRGDSQMYAFNVSAWQHPRTFISIMQNKEKLTPQYIFEQEAAYMQSQWAGYMSYVF